MAGGALPQPSGGGCVLLASGVSATFGLVDTTQSINIVNVQTAVEKLHWKRSCLYFPYFSYYTL